MRLLWPLVVGMVVAGCGAPNQGVPKDKAEPTTPEVRVERKSPLYEELHSGLFQADAAVKKIAIALDLARDVQARAGSDLGEALKDMVATLDDDGDQLADLTGGEPPTELAVNADERAYATRRSELINAIDDALQDLREQEGVAASIAEDGPAQIKKQSAKLDEVLNQAIDDLIGAITALGGKEQGSEDAPDTADTNQRPPAGY